MVIILYILQRIFNLKNNDLSVHILMAFFVILLGLSLYRRYKKKILEAADIEIAVIVVGCIMRLGYMLYTPCNVRSNDMWEFSLDGHGHAGYILGIMLEHHLPQTNDLQFYQQPLYYLMASLQSFFVNLPFVFDDMFYLVDSGKLVSFYSSCITLVYVRNIINLYGIKDKTARIIALCIPCFVPIGFITAGMISTDAITFMFMVLAFYYTHVWYKNSSWKYTIVLAVIYGLGILTKISVGVVAIYTAFVFLYKLIRTKEKGKILIKLLSFGLISFPMGLWFSLRNYLRFGQKLTYVLDQDHDSLMYTGDIPLINRFLIPNVHTLTRPFLDLAGNDYNFIVSYIKSSMFGVHSLALYNWVVYPLFYASVLIALILMVAFVYYVVMLIRKKSGKMEWSLVVMTVLFLMSMISFYYNYPFICVLDFRYYMFLLIPLSVILGKVAERKEMKVFRTITADCLAFYCLLSFTLCFTLFSVNEMINSEDLTFFLQE